MRVWIIQAHMAYEPGQLLGVAASEDSAVAFLEQNGWSPCPQPTYWQKPGEYADSVTIEEHGVFDIDTSVRLHGGM